MKAGEFFRNIMLSFQFCAYAFSFWILSTVCWILTSNFCLAGLEGNHEM